MVYSVLAGIIILVLGVFIFLKPELFWKLTEQWKSYRAEDASDFYIKSTKAGGILFAMLGIAMIILPLVLK